MKLRERFCRSRPVLKPRARNSDEPRRRLPQAILENPDDDSPRLMYADWLTEQVTARRVHPRAM
jgi:uncharacterized protein (TIGR02996 family)